MKAVIQRVISAEVRVERNIISSIGQGLLVLLGVAEGDTNIEVEYLCSKILNLRIFADENGRMNQSLLDTEGEVLLVSQFTLLGDTRRGRRPSFAEAAAPTEARELYTEMANLLAKQVQVSTGIFGATMEVSLTNEGPVTLILETPDV